MNLSDKTGIAGAGGVVVQKAIADLYALSAGSFTTTSTTMVATGLAVTVTPTSITNSLHILVPMIVGNNGINTNTYQIYANGVAIADTLSTFDDPASGWNTYGFTLSGKYQPASLAAVTFEVYMKVSAGTGAVYGSLTEGNSRIIVEEVSPYRILPSGAIQVMQTPAFKATLSANMAAIPDVTWTKVTFDQTDYDTHSGFDAVTNNRFTVPVGGAGLYDIRGFVRSSAAPDGSSGQAVVYVNGVIETTLFGFSSIGAGAQTVAPQVVGMIVLAEGDYIELWTYYNVGTSTETVRNTETFFSAHRVAEL